jgi:GNAT superfamily N-acetyltransferase
MTTTWRLRVELTDRPGTLARLATSLAARQCNILALTVLPAPDGVIDDIVVSVPDELRPADLVIVVRAVGGRCAGITKADLTELTDAPTAALRVAARLVAGSAGYAETIRALLEADAAEPVVVHKPDLAGQVIHRQPESRAADFPIGLGLKRAVAPGEGGGYLRAGDVDHGPLGSDLPVGAGSDEVAGGSAGVTAGGSVGARVGSVAGGSVAGGSVADGLVGLASAGLTGSGSAGSAANGSADSAANGSMATGPADQATGSSATNGSARFATGDSTAGSSADSTGEASVHSAFGGLVDWVATGSAAGGLTARDLGDSRPGGSMAGGSVGVTTGAASDAGGVTTGAAVNSSGGATRTGAAAASSSGGATRTGAAAVDGAAVDGSGGPVTVWAADGTGIVVRRGWAPFAAVELARAVALADLVQALGKTDAQAVITRDGAGIVLRDGRSTDADAVAAMHDRCSRATLFARYHAGTRTIPRRLLHRWLAPPRGRTVLGLVGRQVIAVGQLINTNDPGVGEVSLLVEDDWQGQGVGAALLTHLVRAARAAGHAELFGWCLPGEPGLTKAAQRAGFPVSTRREDDLLRVSLNTHYWPLGASSPRS